MSEIKNKPTDKVRTTPEPVELVSPVDIIECDEGVTILFEVPGANSETVEIEVLNGVLTMNARSSLRRNGRPIVFKRNFRLAEDVNVQQISAKSEDGILRLYIPKGERAKVQRIKVE